MWGVQEVREEREEKKDSQDGGNWERLRTFWQHFIIFFNRNGAKKWEPQRDIVDTWSKGYGKVHRKVPDPPTLLLSKGSSNISSKFVLWKLDYLALAS